MSVSLRTRQVGDVSVVDVNGRITLGSGSDTLGAALRELMNAGHKQILVNLADVAYIDSSGIGELASAFTQISKSGGQLKLLNLTKRVKDILRITRHYTFFDVHDDEAAAIRSFS